MGAFGVGGGVVVLVGLVSLGRTLASAGKRKGTDSWPVVPGVVVASSVESSERDRGLVSVPGVTSARTPLRNVPRVQYTYRVGAQDFTGNRVQRQDTLYSNQSMAQAVAHRYPVGAKVRVAYDPADPASSVLEVESSGVARDLAVGFFVLLFGLAFLLGSLALE